MVHNEAADQKCILVRNHSVLYKPTAIFSKSILWQTGSQCKDLRTGAMWSTFLVLVSMRAEALWIICSCLMDFFLGRPAWTLLSVSGSPVYALWSSLVGRLVLVSSFIQLIKCRSFNDLKASTDLVFDDERHATEVCLHVFSRRQDKNFLDGRTVCWAEHRLSVFWRKTHICYFSGQAWRDVWDVQPLGAISLTCTSWWCCWRVLSCTDQRQQGGTAPRWWTGTRPCTSALHSAPHVPCSEWEVRSRCCFPNHTPPFKRKKCKTSGFKKKKKKNEDMKRRTRHNLKKQTN